MSYFHKAGWPREWITTAEALLREEWNSNYKPTITPIENTSVMVTRICCFDDKKLTLYCTGICIT